VKRLRREAEAEITVKRSRFISIAYPVTSLEEARAKVTETRKKYPDSTHVVHAAVVGKAGTLYSSSDDREPKNTAGRPALEVLKGSGITNICVCIVRYFGGTLLGTGGLVKAYGDSVKEVLKVTETEELVDYASFRIALQYDLYTPVKAIMEKYSCTDITEDFGVGITIKGSIPKDSTASFRSEIEDRGQGRIQLDTLCPIT
jgi:uncharacterized YigZ family protein